MQVRTARDLRHLQGHLLDARGQKPRVFAARKLAGRLGSEGALL